MLPVLYVAVGMQAQTLETYRCILNAVRGEIDGVKIITAALSCGLELNFPSHES